MIAKALGGAWGRFVAIAGCLAVGAAAVTGVAALVGAIDTGVRAQSRRLLGADLAVESRLALPAGLDAFLIERAGSVERTDVVELPTMASGGPQGRSQLVEVRAVRGRFPLHGTLRTSPPELAPGALAADELLAAPDLLRRVGVAVGGEIRIGAAAYRVAGEILEEPDRLDFSLSLGPRVLLSEAGLARADLLGSATRILRRGLFRLPGDPSRSVVEALVADLEAGAAGGVNLEVESHYDAEPVLRRAIRRVEWMLGLSAVLSLVLGGAGVAQIVRAWIEERTRAIAVLRCLGVRPGEIALLAFRHVALLAVAGSAIGAGVGAFAPHVLALVAPDVVPPAIVRFDVLAVFRGFGLGLVVALAFAATSIAAAWRVPPSRVLRADAEPLEAPIAVRAATIAIVALAVFAAAWDRSGRVFHAAAFTASLGVLAALLSAAASLLGRLARRASFAALPTSIRGGLAAIGRPGAGSLASVVALGIGVAAVVAIVVVQRRIDAELLSALPEDAPTMFFVDVQTDQWPEVERRLADAGATRVESVPVVMARLAAVDGRPVEALVAERKDEGRAEWVLTREQRLTTRADVPASNTIVAGTWWKDDGRAEVSLEERYAEDLRAGVGSRVRFDVQGVPIDAVVTSLRSVAWESFAINFFWIAEPGPLDGAPAVRLAAARVPEAAEGALQDGLAESLPNVTVIRLRPLLERIRGVLGRLALALRILAGFSALAGVAVVAGAVSASSLRRRREVALLKTLGATRSRIVARLATEYAVAGAAAGTIGAAAGLALAWAFLAFVVEIPGALPLGFPALAIVAAAAVAAAAGIAVSRSALVAPPIEILRA